ncbi:arabinan endo-1,5-alpha-L-arabinosidase [Cellulomonas endophytica]|uniref:arabinan endo-1,5-alpha-L-arabinosidase n=1 Tax=Cellulomonas endophytica TaxID=2494735 RepID=UPI001F0C600F|nr:arabinan endo-1,5-alpha-L-arabinosidase [Cellulomonas endophytica]
MTGAARRRTVRATAAAALALVVAGGAVAGLALADAGPFAGPSGGSDGGGVREPAATVVPATGDLAVHDPALVVGEEGEPWYVFSTGDLRVGYGAPQVRRSLDAGLTWEPVGTVWDEETRPRWVYERIPTVSNFWAPAVWEHDGLWYLYWSASTFGKNTSVIGLATSPTLDPDDPAYAWTDRGEVWSSGPVDDWNAIDPSLVEDADGTPWMAFGSFWGGIHLLELAWPDGKPVDPAADPVRLAIRGDAVNSIEGPQVVAHDGWFHLFVSRDTCCRGVDSTYSIGVGRSREVTGPYVDREGRRMADGASEDVLLTRGDAIGPGGQSVSGGVLAHHVYDGTRSGAATLGLRVLAWDDEGWPVATTAEEQQDDRDEQDDDEGRG